MKKLSLWVLVIGFLIAISPATSHASPVFFDDFNGSTVNTSFWHIPTWVSPTDGTYVGQTQFRVSQNSPLPSVSNSNVNITVDTYNPTGNSFYGTDLISNTAFAVGQGLDITVRAKMNTPEQTGTVGGIFLYALEPGSNTLHDEIDYELTGNHPNEVQTNVYADEPLGAGHTMQIPYASSSATSYHIYEIKWFPTQVQWYLDGTPIRIEQV